MKTLRNRRLFAVAVLIACGLALLMVVLAGLTGYSPRLRLPAVGVLILGAVVLAPRQTLAMTPLIPAASAVSAIPVSAPFAVLGISCAVGATTVVQATRRSVKISVFMAVSAVALVILHLARPAEYADPVSNQTLLGVVAGLSVCAAAALAQPPRDLFLAATALAGATFALAAQTSGVFATAGRTEAVLSQNANGVGLACGLGIVATLGLVRFNMPKWSAPLAMGIAGINALGLVVAQSQGAFVATGAGIVGVAWIRSKRNVVVLAALGSVVALGALIFLTPLGETLGGVVRNGDDLQGSREVRWALLRASIPLLWQNPVSGLGERYGRLTVDVPGLLSPFGEPLTPHNTLLSIGASFGLVALVAFVVLGFRLAFRCGDDSDRQILLPLVLVYFCAIPTIEWHRIDLSFGFWLVAGLLLSNGRTEHSGASSSATRQPASLSRGRQP